jgi:hypothetical protein
MADEKRLLVGCGIFKAEIEFLRAKNHWPFDTDFLPPSLHIDFKALQTQLCAALDCHLQRECVVFYGACHPLMEQLLDKYHIIRSEGQNCIAMLLGQERFMAELEQGAFFLLDDWVQNWDAVILKTFGNHPQVTKEIFQQQHRYLLCVNTPCSKDFMIQAQAIGQNLGLPVKSITVSLDFLETTLENLLRQKIHAMT